MRGILAIPLLAFIIGCAHRPAKAVPLTPQVDSGDEYTNHHIQKWLSQFDKSSAPEGERPLAYGLARGGAFVVFRNNNRYVYVDSQDNVHVEGWEQVEPKSAASFVPNPSWMRYKVRHYVILPGERPTTDSLTLERLLTDIGQKLQPRLLKPISR